jgi:hypothetical protein
MQILGMYTDFHLAGIPGGIPHATVAQGEPIKPGPDVARFINERIQQAGDAAGIITSPDNLRVVRLTAGIFELGDTTIHLDRAGVVLRGMGENTVLRGENNGNGGISIGKTHQPKWTAAVDVTAAVKVNDSHITVADARGFEPGQIIKIDRYADDAPAAEGGSEWPNGHHQFQRGVNMEYGPTCETNLSRPVSQYAEISRVDGNILHLVNKINIGFPLTGASGKALRPQVFKTEAHQYKYIGLEDIKLQMVAGSDDRGNWSWHSPAVNVRFTSAYSWIKNVESDGTYFDARGRGFMGRHIELQGFRNHVTGCYVHHSAQIAPGGNSYGIRWHGTDCIIDNNICYFLNKSLTGQTSNGGNVIAYNFVPNAVIASGHPNYPDSATPGNPQTVSEWVESATDTSHGGYSHSDLFEGNYTANLHTDGTSGNGMVIHFRNHSFGNNLGGRGPDGKRYERSHWTLGTRAAVSVAGSQNAHVSIGNVYLDPVTAEGAVVWDKPGEAGNGIAVYRMETNTMAGSGLDGHASQRYSHDRFYWAFDYNYAVKGMEPSRKEGWDAPPENLPDSLYLSEAPDYFKGCQWPPVNPFGASDNERVGILPAKKRYDEIKRMEEMN